MIFQKPLYFKELVFRHLLARADSDISVNRHRSISLPLSFVCRGYGLCAVRLRCRYGDRLTGKSYGRRSRRGRWVLFPCPSALDGSSGCSAVLLTCLRCFLFQGKPDPKLDKSVQVVKLVPRSFVGILWTLAAFPAFASFACIEDGKKEKTSLYRLSPKAVSFWRSTNFFVITERKTKRKDNFRT